MRSERDQDRERLEQEIRGEPYTSLLRQLQQANAFLRRFGNWADIIAFMRNGTSRDPLKDEILRPIFQAHAEDEDARWRTILLVIFWPGLESTYYRKRAWDDNESERWSNVTWAFLQVICRIDVSKRPDRLVQKVINDTIHAVHDEYRREWDRTNCEIPTDPDLLEALAGAAEDAGMVEVLISEEREFQIHRLREHMEVGCITETDLALIVGTRVYGRPLRECAEEADLSYEAAKKRRHRAEAAIRSFGQS
ncbi:MAG: hypothetical protein J7M19_00670 [Planctomycetes bacterium]|nr:hypothetical protein [Planctomycetota bacterium]